MNQKYYSANLTTRPCAADCKAATMILYNYYNDLRDESKTLFGQLDYATLRCGLQGSNDDLTIGFRIIQRK